MREFPNATPRPWKHRLSDDCSVVGANGEEVATTCGIFRDAYADNFEGMEADAALIVHAVNTMDERERLLEEAAGYLRDILEIALRNEGGTRISRARAFLAKLEARDA
jgi:hypothetical protein